ncbi:UNVERIFIED_ORG: hypothetical protein J2740_000591 [Rhizobium nepotum]|jgi:hypothetical protein|nr:hypothetical protein [Rhizobium nepotum]
MIAMQEIHFENTYEYLKKLHYKIKKIHGISKYTTELIINIKNNIDILEINNGHNMLHVAAIIRQLI